MKGSKSAAVSHVSIEPPEDREVDARLGGHQTGPQPPPSDIKPRNVLILFWGKNVLVHTLVDSGKALLVLREWEMDIHSCRRLTFGS